MSLQLGRTLQDVALKILLAFAYVFGVGLSRVLTELFARRLFRSWRVPVSEKSYWQDAKGYQLEAERYEKQV